MNAEHRVTIRRLGPGSLGLQPRPVVGDPKPSELITWHLGEGGTYLIDENGQAYRRILIHALYEDESRCLYRVRDGKLEKVSIQPTEIKP